MLLHYLINEGALASKNFQIENTGKMIVHKLKPQKIKGSSKVTHFFSGQVRTRKQVSVPLTQHSFHIYLTGFLHGVPRVPVTSEMGGRADRREGQRGKRAGRGHSLPGLRRKLAAQLGANGTRGAHLSGTQRRVVRSRDTDTKAPGG